MRHHQKGDQMDRIIVGIDFSAGSAAALKHAARMSESESASLELFHVVPGRVVSDLADALGRSAGSLEKELTDDVRRQLEDLLPADLSRDRVSVDVAIGSPLNETLQAVERRRPDLLVLGVTGDDSGRSRGAGTFATKSIRKAKSDVLLVDQNHTGPFRTIVVGVDFSDTSKRALARAVECARRDESRVHVLHVYFGPWNKLHYRSPTPEATPEFRRQYCGRLQGLLNAFIEPFASDLPSDRIQGVLHEHQSYGGGIIEYAAEHDADLLVLGALGTTNLRYMLLGSTAERVLRETPCSVLTVRPGDEG